jgi:hypothetical protein
MVRIPTYDLMELLISCFFTSFFRHFFALLPLQKGGQLVRLAGKIVRMHT